LPPPAQKRELSTGRLLALIGLCLVGGVLLGGAVIFGGCMLILNGLAG
jgi:hypothetical protein